MERERVYEKKGLLICEWHTTAAQLCLLALSQVVLQTTMKSQEGLSIVVWQTNMCPFALSSVSLSIVQFVCNQQLNIVFNPITNTEHKKTKSFSHCGCQWKSEKKNNAVT